MALLFRVVNSPFGIVLSAISQNEQRAVALGYRVHRYKLAIFVMAGALSGLAGALFALANRLAGLEMLDWHTSGSVVMMAVLGGSGTLIGPIIGAAVYESLNYFVSKTPIGQQTDLVMGLIFAACVLAFRRRHRRRITITYMAEDFDLELLRGRLRAHQFGDPPDVPVFCVPGLSSNSRVFDALGEYRQARGARYRGLRSARARIERHHRRRGPTVGNITRKISSRRPMRWAIEHFDLVGHSMGAFVGMTAVVARSRSSHSARLVLIDGAGDPTQTALTAIVAGIGRLENPFPTRDAYVEAVSSTGMVVPWNEYWERHYRYDLIDTDAGVRPRTDLAAVDRRCDLRRHARRSQVVAR